jgi:predicted nucleic acid-binding protein
VIEPEEALLMSAAELRAETDIPLLDAVVAQTAIANRAAVLTADPDFRRVATRVRVIWVR